MMPTGSTPVVAQPAQLGRLPGPRGTVADAESAIWTFLSPRTAGDNAFMTLIGTLASSSVVVQVSDRRISLLHSDGSIELRDDLTNKAVLYENRATLAFTGLAKLENETTDLWIAQRLASTPNLNDGLEKLTSDLTTLFRRRPYRGQPHSIVITGWKRNGPDEPTAFSGLVSNQFEIGKGWRHTPSTEFDWFVQMVQPDLPTLVFAPDLVPRRAAKSLYRKLLRVKSRGLNIANAVGLIADEIRSISEYRPTVGPELMVSVLPRSAVPRGLVAEMSVMSGRITPDMPTFYSLTATGDQVHYGPTIVMNGMIMSGFQARPIADD